MSRVLDVLGDQVAGHLRDLHGLDFVFPSAQDPELMYSFKHALTQDVVYASVLERRRRQYHAVAGHGLEELYAGRIDEVVELLAYHFGRSEEAENAVDYALLAAEKAQRRWANTEALAYFDDALKRLSAMPDTEANRLRRIDATVQEQRAVAELQGAHAVAAGVGDEYQVAVPGSGRCACSRRLVLLDRVPAQPHGRTAPGGDRLLPPGGGDRRRRRTR